MSYHPAADRYERMPFARCGLSGLRLPRLSLGLWHNFGTDRSLDLKSAMCRAAFDHGIVHFDLANNYGPPPGSAEEAFGTILRRDFARHRDELIVSTKAGYEMWDGPYGQWGSRKHVIASCDQSLRRLGLDYVDVFYSHRFDPNTPLEEAMGALDQIVRSGKALYVGLSSYNSRRTREAAAILRAMGTPLVLHQPAYNILNRWVERDGLTATLGELGLGGIAFSPLAQGMLSLKYLKGVPDDSRAAQDRYLARDKINDDLLARIHGLNEVAKGRGQSLVQMAIAWVLRDPAITSALIGASSPAQILECVGALDTPEFTAAELQAIDDLTPAEDETLWAQSSERV